MIAIARKKTSENDSLATGPVFLVQDMRSLSPDGGFDAAICMFGGFGYLDTDEDLSRFFSGLLNVLVPGGLFLFEFWNIGGLKHTPYRTSRKVEMGEGAYYNLSESRYLPDRGILEISMQYLLTRESAVVEDFMEEHSMRIYSLSEIRRLLSVHGFSLLEAFDEKHLDRLIPPSKEAFRIFAVAQAGGEQSRQRSQG